MPTDLQSKTSFSPWRKVTIALNVFVVIVAVLAVVVMLNYLGRHYYQRFQWSTRRKIELAPRTLSLLHSLTNQVKVTLYYDKKEPLYGTVMELLDQYTKVNPRITVQTVDYLRDPGAAQKLKADYGLALGSEKNLIIFDSDGRTKILDGNALTHYIIDLVGTGSQPEYRKKPTEFEGETRLSAALLAVTSPNPMRAWFLQVHREHALDSGGDYGYLKFKTLLQRNYVDVMPASLVGTNALQPTNCDLLIIAGPMDAFSGAEPGKVEVGELEKIEQYLEQGGRLLLLCNAYSIDSATGQEKTGLQRVLRNWGIELGNQVIRDPGASIRGDGYDMVVRNFNQNQPVVNPLLESGLYLFRPRAVSKVKGLPQTAGAPRVEELAFTGPKALASQSATAQSYPLIAAVEKGAIPGVVTERPVTRMVVAGDSFFLANGWIDSAGNRTFAEDAVNWLVNRPELLEGVGPRPVREYRILMSSAQFQRAEWLLLGGMPGGALALGGLVWLRRRK